MADIWYPIEGDETTWDRAFRIEIDNEEIPVLKMFVERAYLVNNGEKTLTERRPELDATISMMDAMKDAELSPIVSKLAPLLEKITKILWERKNNPIIPEVIPDIIPEEKEPTPTEYTEEEIPEEVMPEDEHIPETTITE